MAIKDVITLGLGCSPGSIKFLLLLGLDISALVISAGRTYTVDAETRTWVIAANTRTFTVDSEDRILEVV